MMDNQRQAQDKRFQQVADVVLNNEEFLVVADGSNYDSIAAATAVALVLRSLNKKVILYSPIAVRPDQFSSLVGVDQFDFQLETNNRKLLITLDCPIDQIERVTSDDQGEKLTLTVEFRKGVQIVPPERVQVRPGRPEFKAGFIFDCQLKKEAEITQKGSWIWLSAKGNKKPWAIVSFVDPKATLSELTASMISHAGFKPTLEAANNLFLGIKRGTENFERADSVALETAAYCLRIKEGIEKRTIKPGEKVIPQTPLEAVEKKEGKAPSVWQKPPIFTGATTPKV